MDGKTSDWRPGPSVCRCCLAEGCYKDISTEYFWMGKREVYAEMLSDTFSVSIAYSSAGGPNSHSRLICEPCISRLRDAADFKRQVQECERTFMQHLDPGGTSALNDNDIELQSMGKEVKLEQVKVEKRFSDDEFDNIAFGDDDDDDMDDQPLTKFATKVPKKETVDFMDLIDNSQITVKRMANSKTKGPPAKKIKVTKKAPSKPTTSKAPIKVVKEKKKKGREDETQIRNNVPLARPEFPYYLVTTPRDGEEKRAAFRNNITTILESCTAYPFKYRKGAYMCFFCKSSFLEPEKLRIHTLSHHPDFKQMKPRKYEPIKMDFAVTRCKICEANIKDYSALKNHLTTEHGKVIDSTHGESILPYNLNKTEHSCQICGKRYEMFLSLHKHMNEHYDHFICETCGKRFATSQRLVNHARTHETGNFPCKRCELIFQTYSARYAHIAKIHRSNKRYKCPICDEKFSSYKHRLKHLSSIHGEKTAVFPCPSCPRVFDLCSRRTAHIKFQHLQERKHVCSDCGMKFFTNYELQEHCIKHGGERIYQCDVCKKAYARLKTLKEHMRIHNNDRRFVCSECKQSFVQNCSLKQHIRVHHPALMK